MLLFNFQVVFSERNKPSSRSLSTVARQVYSYKSSFSSQAHSLHFFGAFYKYDWAYILRWTSQGTNVSVRQDAWIGNKRFWFVLLLHLVEECFICKNRHKVFVKMCEFGENFIVSIRETIKKTIRKTLQEFQMLLGITFVKVAKSSDKLNNYFFLVVSLNMLLQYTYKGYYTCSL